MGDILQFEYPNARRDDNCKEIIHGVEIADVYRWLEDPDSEETKHFVEQQNAVSMPFITSCPYREKINKRLNELWNYPKYDCPFKRGNKYFFYKNDGLQNQFVLYIQESLDSEPRVFLDPNEINVEGTTAITVTAFSEDGQWFAYGLSDAGSDWVRIKIRNVETGIDCEETLEKCKYTSISWTHDNKGFFYSCYPDHCTKSDGTETQMNEYQKMYYHRINTSQCEDILVVQFPDKPRWRSHGEVSNCGRYLFVSVDESCHYNLIYYTPLDVEKEPIVGELKLIPVFDKFEADYELVTNNGDIAFFRTNKDSPNYKLIEVDIKNPSQANWKESIPEHEKDVLDDCFCVYGNILVVLYLRDVVNVIELRKLEDGSLIKPLDIPIGTIQSLSGKRKQSEIFFYVTSFLSPGVIYHCDLSQNLEPKIFREITVKDFDQSEFITEQVFYESKDKTKVPMFIVRPKNLLLDGSNPCLLHGYGGFNFSYSPMFGLSRILLMKHLKGMFAVANIRGGGEYGEKWHDGGRLFNKQNCFDDFIAAAEYLINNKYTCTKKLAIKGGSNGGLLVAACSNQRPDLFGCAIAHVGVMDMLRFHKFTIGHSWVSDYGNPDEENHFKNVLKFSPLHNVPTNVDNYPATLLLTADHDDRVVPLHSLKYIAQLQHVLGKRLKHVPIMIRVDVNAGHGGGKPTSKLIEELTEVFCFIIKTLDLVYYD
ncbi:prolyl endopeptidase-like protein [Dinothrombium tinctorium]|uniref:Prolyl endopeptidase n=1 Tax=Dinothrombium tinctorium TaxID=1965070 RepID=A0A443QZ63_9ACAR|nr:prolyl endopeptidase-like protein [Dinothrombium tinctorium]